jgi:hypothetical protein
MLTSGCATAVFDKRACPKEKEYTREQQTRIADALVRADPVLKSAMVDYGKLRDKARACRGARVR